MAHYNDEKVSTNYENAFFYSDLDYQRNLLENLVPHFTAKGDCDIASLKIADIGGGTGNFTQALAEALALKENNKILCVDPFEEMLKQASCHMNVETLRLDALTFSQNPHKKNAFHYLLFKEVIHHVAEEDFGTLMSGSFQQLKEGGKMIVITRPQSTDYPFFPLAHSVWRWYQPSHETIGTFLLRCGFKVQLQEVDYEVKLAKTKWIEMVSNRFWSTFSHMTQKELDDGIKYIEEKYQEDILSFNDKMLFIIATKPQSNTDDKQLGISKGDASSSKDLGSQLKKIAKETCKKMNTDYQQSLVAYAKWYGKFSNAVLGTEMTNINERGFELKVKLSDGTYVNDVLIPFNKAVEDASQIRKVAVSMHHEAFGKLKGIDNKLIYYSDAVRMIVKHTGGTNVWIALLVCITGIIVCLINMHAYEKINHA